LIASASEHISGYSFVFLVATFGVAFSLGWTSEQYDRWKVKVKGQKKFEAASGGKSLEGVGYEQRFLD
jgi:hypothetical protein